MHCAVVVAAAMLVTLHTVALVDVATREPPTATHCVPSKIMVFEVTKLSDAVVNDATCKVHVIAFADSQIPCAELPNPTEMYGPPADPWTPVVVYDPGPFAFACTNDDRSSAALMIWLLSVPMRKKVPVKPMMSVRWSVWPVSVAVKTGVALSAALPTNAWIPPGALVVAYQDPPKCVTPSRPRAPKVDVETTLHEDVSLFRTAANGVLAVFGLAPLAPTTMIWLGIAVTGPNIPPDTMPC